MHTASGIGSARVRHAAGASTTLAAEAADHSGLPPLRSGDCVNLHSSHPTSHRVPGLAGRASSAMAAATLGTTVAAQRAALSRSAHSLRSSVRASQVLRAAPLRQPRRSLLGASPLLLRACRDAWWCMITRATSCAAGQKQAACAGAAACLPAAAAAAAACSDAPLAAPACRSRRRGRLQQRQRRRAGRAAGAGQHRGAAGPPAARGRRALCGELRRQPQLRCPQPPPLPCAAASDAADAGQQPLVCSCQRTHPPGHACLAGAAAHNPLRLASHAAGVHRFLPSIPPPVDCRA